MDYKSLEAKILLEGETCPKCKGKGKLKVYNDPKNSETKKCHYCNGKGKVIYYDACPCP